MTRNYRIINGNRYEMDRNEAFAEFCKILVRNAFASDNACFSGLKESFAPVFGL